MAGWVHRQTMEDEITASVGPTPTTLGEVISNAAQESASGFIKNEDATQNVTVWLETSWDGVSGWVPLDAINAALFATPLAPKERRWWQVDTVDLKHIRRRGQADGAGTTVTLSRQAAMTSPHR